MDLKTLNAEAIANFRSYLRLRTVQPEPDYASAVHFLRLQATQLGLACSVTELVPGQPIILMHWPGSAGSSRSSVVLNSHVDVVPVFLEHWSHDPFAADMDESGKIFARGAQDMKCVGSQYLEAIRRLKVKCPEYRPERDVYVLFVPDEEVGGKRGMLPLVNSDLFRDMRVGLVMDEGLASPTDTYSAFYGDRVVWWMRFHCSGSTGHGSQFLLGTAGQKMNRLLHRFMEFRDAEEGRMKDNDLTLGDVTTVNVTGCGGGVQHNVVPDKLTLDIDMRITPSADLDQMRAMIDQWITEAGGGIEIEFVQHAKAAHLTDTTSANPWWTCFKDICNEMDMKTRSQVFPAGTDSRYVREKGIPAIGFSPMNKTPVLLHDHDEFLRADTFIHGVDFYEKLIPALAAVPDF